MGLRGGDCRYKKSYSSSSREKTSRRFLHVLQSLKDCLVPTFVISARRPPRSRDCKRFRSRSRLPVFFHGSSVCVTSSSTEAATAAGPRHALDAGCWASTCLDALQVTFGPNLEAETEVKVQFSGEELYGKVRIVVRW